MLTDPQPAQMHLSNAARHTAWQAASTPYHLDACCRRFAHAQYTNQPSGRPKPGHTCISSPLICGICAHCASRSSMPSITVSALRLKSQRAKQGNAVSWCYNTAVAANAQCEKKHLPACL
jgi:hypothetical protein